MSLTAGTKRRGEGILRMEDAGTLEEDDIDSQDSNTSIDHGHLARNCSIKIILLLILLKKYCTKLNVVYNCLWVTRGVRGESVLTL